MKKFILFAIILCFLSGIVICQLNKPKTNSDGTIEYNFLKQSQIISKLILYNYVLKDLNKTPKELKEFANITLKSVKAFSYDLNDDGEKEIIGVVYSSYYWGTAGYSLFILEKSKNIADLNFEPLKEFYILTDKTQGYKDIKLYGSSAYNFKPMTARFNGNKYYNREQDEMFREYMIDFADYDVSEIINIEK